MTSSRHERSGEAATDAELVYAFKGGDIVAFTALVERHERALINFFYQCSWDHQVSEDCAQEVFVKLYAHLDRYEAKAKFTTFLYRVARNHWIDRIRSNRRPGVSLDAPAGAEGSRSLKEQLPARSEAPTDRMMRLESAEKLQRALDQLPEDQRTVVILSELQGMRYQEIAEVMDVPVGTIKSRMFTAMQRLKELLSNEL